AEGGMKYADRVDGEAVEGGDEGILEVTVGERLLRARKNVVTAQLVVAAGGGRCRRRDCILCQGGGGGSSDKGGSGGARGEELSAVHAGSLPNARVVGHARLENIPA